jgi:hypothetical protein
LTNPSHAQDLYGKEAKIVGLNPSGGTSVSRFTREVATAAAHGAMPG